MSEWTLLLGSSAGVSAKNGGLGSPTHPGPGAWGWAPLVEGLLDAGAGSPSAYAGQSGCGAGRPSPSQSHRRPLPPLVCAAKSPWPPLRTELADRAGRGPTSTPRPHFSRGRARSRLGPPPLALLLWLCRSSEHPEACGSLRPCPRHFPRGPQPLPGRPGPPETSPLFPPFPGPCLREAGPLPLPRPAPLETLPLWKPPRPASLGTLPFGGPAFRPAPSLAHPAG